MAAPEYKYNVFINCPFDKRYKRLFHAIVFTVTDCGYNPRCALELDDGSQERLSKILEIVGECQFGIHDISRTQLDSHSKLPRFNMPLELGIFLGAKEFGHREQKRKNCLILDKEKYRYQKFISDLAGNDIKAHSNSVQSAIGAVRDWLATASKELIPGKKIMIEKFLAFETQLPRQASRVHIDVKDLTFSDLMTLSAAWLEKYADVIES